MLFDYINLCKSMKSMKFLIVVGFFIVGREAPQGAQVYICTILYILKNFRVLSSTTQRHSAHSKGFIVLSYSVYLCNPGGYKDIVQSDFTFVKV